MTTITCAREGCGISKAVRNRKQRYCSRRCDMLCRDPEQKRAAGIKGGHAAGKQRWERAMAAWRKRYPRMPAMLAAEIYDMGYSAGWNAKKGYERRRDAGEAMEAGGAGHGA